MIGNKRFYIGCLPRSGSAWMTAAINACTPLRAGHEALGRYPDTWDDEYHGGVGSDILVPAVAQKALVERGITPILYYVHRPFLEVRDSLVKCGTYTSEAFIEQLAWDSDFYLNYVDPRNRFQYPHDLEKLVRRVAFDMGVWCDEVKLREMALLRVTSRRWNDSIEEVQ